MVWNHSPDIDATLPGAVSEGFAADVVWPLNSRTLEICLDLFQVPLLNAVPRSTDHFRPKCAIFNAVADRLYRDFKMTCRLLYRERFIAKRANQLTTELV
jgi:hypothetical protein